MKWTGIDLGMDRIRIFSAKKVYYDQPFALILDSDKKIAYKGDEALSRHIYRRAGLIRPLEQDHIRIKLAARLLEEILAETRLVSLWKKPNLILALPGRLSQEQHAYLLQRLLDYGAGQVKTFCQLDMAVKGSGFDVSGDFATCFLHIGANECLLAVYVKGRRVAYDSCPLAGNQIDNAIYHWMASRFGLEISQQNIDQIKSTLLMLDRSRANLALPVEGIEIRTGRFASVKLESMQVQKLFEQIAKKWIIWILNDLRKLPPAMQKDVFKRGIIASGGMFCRQGLSEFLSQQLGCPLFCPELPDQVVGQGILNEMAAGERRFRKGE